MAVAQEIDWICEERVPVGDEGETRWCGRHAYREYLPRPLPSGPAWIAVCDAHAEVREKEGLFVREFTGMARW